MSIKPSIYSRFGITDPIIYNNRETYGLLKKYSFLNRENLTNDQITKLYINNYYAGRPDRIATDIYGNYLLDWVVILFNRPRNPLNWPNTGTIIELPISNLVFINL